MQRYKGEHDDCDIAQPHHHPGDPPAKRDYMSYADIGFRLLVATGLLATSDGLIEALVAGAVTALLVLDWLLVRSLRATVKSAIATAERAVELTQSVVERCTMRTVS